MTDEELIIEFLEGNERGFERLMRRYQPQAYCLARAITNDREEAKDITQKAFIQAFKRLSFLRQRNRFRSWFFKIILNLCRDYLKNKKPTMSLETDKEPATSFEEEVIKRDLKEKTKKALSLLPPRQKEVIILRVFQGLSFNEISEILDFKPETARTNFYFGVRNLKQLLRED